jgi:hypothetical protein
MRVIILNTQDHKAIYHDTFLHIKKILIDRYLIQESVKMV